MGSMWWCNFFTLLLGIFLHSWEPLVSARCAVGE